MESKTPEFNEKAPAQEAFSFEAEMRRKFGEDTARQIVATLAHLQIPLPQGKDQYLDAHAGALIFSNRHGIMLRIETPTVYVPDDEGFAVGIAVRANDSAWMLQPLGTVKAGKALIEIIPGIHYEPRDAESRKLYWKMWSDGYDYWDDRIDNIGRLPKLPQLPGPGVPVIIDRLAVQKLSGSAAPFHRALEVLKGEKNLYKYRSPVRVPPSPNSELRQEWDQMVQEVLGHKVDPAKIENHYDREGYEAFISRHGEFWPKGQAPREASQDQYIAIVKAFSVLTQERIKDQPRSREALGENDPQEILYGGLRRAFAVAWREGADAPDAAKMAGFWRQVLLAKAEGRLVPGWNELTKDDGTKFTKAPRVAKAYDEVAEGIGRQAVVVKGQTLKK